MHYLFLSKPSVVYKKQYLEMIREWTRCGEDLVPWVLKLDHSRFEQFIGNLEKLRQGLDLTEGQVRCSTFWLVRSDGKILGAVIIRHQLNQFLSDYGGHIGYGIRPSERRKGYGTAILRLSLLEAKKLDIHKVRITCSDGNIASEKIILRNGGVFDSKGVENGSIIKRFWIQQ